MNAVKVVSLFSGCGGFDLGVEGGFQFLGRTYPRHNTEIVYANDIAEKACDIYDVNFNLKATRGDIAKVETSTIPDHDILIGGFPCQSFSLSAQNPPRLGITDERGQMFLQMVKVLKERLPSVFIAENVKGILSANKGLAFPLIVKEFEDAGYNVTHKVLKSVEYGIPQKRERVFIVGFRSELANSGFGFPLDTDVRANLNEVLDSEDSIPDKYFFSKRAVEGMRKANKKMNKGRAQNVEGPCNTVTSHLAKVSINSTDPVLKIGGRYRRLMPIEVARVQSFPETFNLVGSDSAKYKALGNAVPPVLAWNLIDSVLIALAKKEAITKSKFQDHGYKPFR